MENNFYHNRLPPLNVTILITHVRNLQNACYANGLVKMVDSIHSARHEYVSLHADQTQ